MEKMAKLENYRKLKTAEKDIKKEKMMKDNLQSLKQKFDELNKNYNAILNRAQKLTNNQDDETFLRNEQ